MSYYEEDPLTAEEIRALDAEIVEGDDDPEDFLDEDEVEDDDPFADADPSTQPRREARMFLDVDRIVQQELLHTHVRMIDRTEQTLARQFAWAVNRRPGGGVVAAEPGVPLGMSFLEDSADMAQHYMHCCHVGKIAPVVCGLEIAPEDFMLAWFKLEAKRLGVPLPEEDPS